MTTLPTRPTPTQHSQTAQGLKGEIEHPNYASWQTRTGLVPWFVNDTKGNEFILSQHRSGTYWEMTPTGAFVQVASKNREDITFGKHVTRTTGSHDITVDGGSDSSVKTTGSRRITTDGDSEMTTKGKMVMSMKNMSILSGEFVDISGQAFTAKMKSVVMHASDGPISLNAAGDGNLTSSEGSVALLSKSGAVTLDAGSDISIWGSESTHIKGGGGEIVAKDGKVYINSGMFKAPSQVWKGRPAGAQSKEADWTNTDFSDTPTS